MEKFNPAKTRQLNKVNSLCRIFFHTKKRTDPFTWTEYENILILDFNMIGDMVMLIPFLRIVKKNAPRARVTLVCASWGKAVLENQGLVDEFVVCNSRFLSFSKSVKDELFMIKKAIRQVNQKTYDVALEPRGDIRDIFFMHFCKAKRKVSYNYTKGECFLTDVIVPSASVEHLVEDKLYFLDQIGCRYEKEDTFPRLTLTDEQRRENEQFITENQLENKILIGIHPGASMEIKQWDGFAELLVKIASDPKNRDRVAFLVFEGPREEEAAAKVMEAADSCHARAILSKSDIPHYMQRLALCDKVICNDSGAGHIAAAFGAEVHVIFGPVTSKMASPYKEKGVFVYSYEDLECKPCMSRTCAHNLECMKAITVDMIKEKIRIE